MHSFSKIIIAFLWRTFSTPRGIALDEIFQEMLGVLKLHSCHTDWSSLAAAVFLSNTGNLLVSEVITSTFSSCRRMVMKFLAPSFPFATSFSWLLCKVQIFSIIKYSQGLTFSKVDDIRCLFSFSRVLRWTSAFHFRCFSFLSWWDEVMAVSGKRWVVLWVSGTAGCAACCTDSGLSSRLRQEYLVVFIFS